MPRASTVRFSVHALVSQHVRPAPGLPPAPHAPQPQSLPPLSARPSSAATAASVAASVAPPNNGPLPTAAARASSACGSLLPDDLHCDSAAATGTCAGWGAGLHHRHAERQGGCALPGAASGPVPAHAPAHSPTAALSRNLSLGAEQGAARVLNLQGEIEEQVAGGGGSLAGSGAGLSKAGARGVGDGRGGGRHLLEQVAGSPAEAEVGLEGDAWMEDHTACGAKGTGPHLGPGGGGGSGATATYWGISFRVANIRKHSLLHPEVRAEGGGACEEGEHEVHRNVRGGGGVLRAEEHARRALGGGRCAQEACIRRRVLCARGVHEEERVTCARGMHEEERVTCARGVH